MRERVRRRRGEVAVWGLIRARRNVAGDDVHFTVKLDA